MEVKIAKNAGYCFGVKRAMKMALDELESSEDGIYALGPLIHNKQAVSKYEELGLKTINDLEEVPNNKSMIIRSHGVGEDVYISSKKKDLQVIDTTCPFVKKIHDIAKKYYEQGYKLIVIGDSKHPEVIGINGWCNNDALIIKTIEEAKSLSLDDSFKYCVVAQTTINLDLYEEIINILKEKNKDITLNNTICLATKVRQQSAKDLSKEVDIMIVIGGKHSSNTQKLVGICKDTVKTISIETKEDININDFKDCNIVGITAGASTPDWIISEVIEFVKKI